MGAGGGGGVFAYQTRNLFKVDVLKMDQIYHLGDSFKLTKEGS